MASVEEFVKAPSEDVLNLFVKQQLWELVEHFKIGDVDKRIKKNELRSIVRNWLIENNFLIISAQKKHNVERNPMDIFSGLSFEQRKEILQIQQNHDKELVKETKRFEFEIEKLRTDNLNNVKLNLHRNN